MSTRFIQRVIDKAASYTVSPRRDLCGQVFTNRGAVGGITFTLPKPDDQLLGWWYEFIGNEPQSITVASAVAGDIVTLGDQAANSVALQTGGQIVGGCIRARCVRTAVGAFKWHVAGVAVGHTYTVAT